MEQRNNKKLRIIWDVCLTIITVLGFALLIYSAMHGDRYRFFLQEVKAVSYICMNLLLSRILFRLLAGCRNRWKYFWVVTLNLIITCGICVFNNLLHYHGFFSMFGYPEDIKLYHFIVSDLKYSIGLGQFRYILFFLLGVMSFVVIDEGLYKVVWKGLKKFCDFLSDILFAVFERLGLLKLFGLSCEEEITETVAEAERQQLIEHLNNHTELDLSKRVTDDDVTYVVVINSLNGGVRDE